MFYRIKLINIFLSISLIIFFLSVVLNLLFTKKIFQKIKSDGYLNVFDKNIYQKIDKVKYFKTEFNGSKIDYSTYVEEIYDATNVYKNIY